MTGASAHSQRETSIVGLGLIIPLCLAATVIEGFDIQAMGVSGRAISAELQLSPAQNGSIQAASNIGLVFGAVIGGWLADRLGRKPVLIASVATFGLFTLMTMQSRDFDMLFYARLLTGVGFGGALPNIMAIAADSTPPDRRGSTSALMFSGMPIGGGVVALIAWLGTGSDWRTLFLIGGVIPLALVPALVFLLRETRRPQPEPSSYGQRLLWLAVVPLGVAFWLAVRAVASLPFFAPLSGVAAWLGAVLGLLAAYLVVHRKPLFKDGRAAASLLLWLAFVPTLLILYLILAWLPALVAAKGFPKDANLAAVWFNFVGVGGAIVLGLFVDRFGPRWPLLFAFAGLVASLALWAAATAFWPVMLLSGAVGMFVLSANYALYGIAPSYYPADMRGRGAGASIAWGRLGSVSGPLLAGVLLQGGASASDVALSMAPFATIAAIALLILTIAAKPVS
ncbi:MAG TPA: MFS transporter [Hyphomonadaceae bacterium]|nr:MFS transporter [Hyphomonadaceae bacterium]